MKILVGCECSQVVTAAFLARGHDAYSCDLQESYGDFPARHIVGDVRTVFFDVQPDLFIAHPPCTYLSTAGARHMYAGGRLDVSRAELAYQARDLFLWCLQAPAPMVCVENPIPLSEFMPIKYDQIIEPYFFGHPYSKATCLWLRGLPPLQSTKYIRHGVRSWVFSHRSQRLRSQTFSGIADAMADQWGDCKPIHGFLY